MVKFYVFKKIGNLSDLPNLLEVRWITHLMWWHMRYCHVVAHVVVGVRVWK
jgi:hypothetical protein